MGNIAWWILGALVVGGGAVAYYVTREGEKKPVAEVCLKDLTEPMFSSVKRAMDAKDVAALNAYALEAHGKGWTCAANEMTAAAKRFEAEKKKIDKSGPAINPTDLALDPLGTDPAKITPLESDPLDTGLATCANSFSYLNGEEQGAIVAAINKYRSTGDGSTLKSIADLFASTGSIPFANCMRAQAEKVGTMTSPLLPVTAAEMELPASWA